MKPSEDHKEGGRAVCDLRVTLKYSKRIHVFISLSFSRWFSLLCKLGHVKSLFVRRCTFYKHDDHIFCKDFVVDTSKSSLQSHL